MVEREVAERAVMAVLDAQPPAKADAGEARRQLGSLLAQYGWHHWALEETVHWVSKRHEQSQAEAERRARRSASPPAHLPVTVAGSRVTRTAAR